MIPMEHPWTEWQEDGEPREDYKPNWKWKENTPKKIKKQYEEWEKFYNRMMKIK